MNANDSRAAGFTLVEVTIILLVLVILSTILLPQLGNYNRLARFVKVHEDIGAFCASIKKMLDETMNNAFWGDPVGKDLPVGLLAGEVGDIPGINPNIPGTNPLPETWAMSVPSGPTFEVIADAPQGASSSRVFYTDSFENHLQTNSPLFRHTASGMSMATSQYDTARVLPAEWWAMGWHGPYFNKIDTDPWGNRYACNVFALHSTTLGEVYTSAVVCLSAGPNEIIDTPFNMAYKATSTSADGGYMIGLDDVACVLSGGGPF